MFAGHMGAALAIARAEREVNVGVFVTAALILDVLLWTFVLLGWESATIPADFASTHQPAFVFPYSHGLLASLAWAALAGLGAIALAPHLKRKWRAAALVALAVLSHWVLDALVHRPELPLAGPTSRAVGLRLWDHMNVALTLEALLTLAGVGLYVSAPALRRSTRIALIALTLIVLALTLAGMTVAPPPPSARAMAVSSLLSLALVCALTYWFGRARPA